MLFGRINRLYRKSKKVNSKSRLWGNTISYTKSLIKLTLKKIMLLEWEFILLYKRNYLLLNGKYVIFQCCQLRSFLFLLVGNAGSVESRETLNRLTAIILFWTHVTESLVWHLIVSHCPLEHWNTPFQVNSNMFYSFVWVRV